MSFPKLPVEIITYILSFLPKSDLVTASRVTHLFNHESEIYLYRNVYIARKFKFAMFLRATEQSHRRKTLVQSLDCDISICFAALVSALKGDFRNLTRLSCLPGLPSSGAMVPPVEGANVLKLQSLTCDPHVDEYFISFLKTQPTITSLNIVSESVSCIPSADILPALENFSCSARDLPLFVRGRPLTKIEILGGLELHQLVEQVLPDLVRPITPLTSLKITVSGITTRCMVSLAASLPCLENLTVHDSIGVLPEMFNDQEIDLSSTDWTSCDFPFVTLEILAQLLLPVSRLCHLRQFCFSTISILKEDKIRCVFHWRDTLANLHTLILQDKKLVRDASDREWCLISLEHEEVTYRGLRAS